MELGELNVFRACCDDGYFFRLFICVAGDFLLELVLLFQGLAQKKKTHAKTLLQLNVVFNQRVSDFWRAWQVNQDVDVRHLHLPGGSGGLVVHQAPPALPVGP